MGRIISYGEKTGYNDGDYLLIDNGEDGTKRIHPSLVGPRVDSAPTQGSNNAVSSGGVYDALHDTDTTLTQSGQAADAKVVGDEIEDIRNKKFGFVKVLTSADDLDDYYETGAYCWLGLNMPIHSPVVGSNCVMSVSHGYGNVGHSVQYVSSVSGKFLQRIQYTSGNWTPWVDNQNNSIINSLKDELIAYNSIDVFSRSTYTQGSLSGIDYTRNADGSWTISGTASANSFCNIISSPSVLPEYIRPGRTYHINFNGGDVPIRIYTNFSDGTNDYKTINESSDFTIPENTIGIIIRWQIYSGTVVNATVNYTMIGLPLYVSKEGDTIQNIYNYNNTYNIDTNPTITTDSHGWLEANDTDTSDETGKTDMTGAIMSMLNDTGYCHLGEGIFYVSGNIDMPEGSTLCGCGKKTVIRLLQSTTTGYCVKIGKYCTIKDISFEGARSFAVPSTKGTRNGIAFMANYDASPSVTTEHCMISNVWCKFFSGAGIYCHNTSIRYDKGLYATNVFIKDCYAGIDIDYYSEFNKFVNICTAWCKYGCINNGGNNVFSSCTFHATEVGFYIDGTQPNHGHGTLTGCTFCHIGSNAGIAIKLESVTNGFIIDACQVWYNSIGITGSSGIVISNCELGRGTTGAGATINITDGATILFTGCMFVNDVNYAPDINIVNNDKVKFTNCFGSVSGSAISA